MSSNVPRTIFQPRTQYALQKGIHEIVNAIRPTLGPLPRLTMLQKASGKGLELLDDGGVIARRIFQIQDGDANMGAMLTRHMLWELHEKVGDGTATAAVILQKIYDEGLQFVVSGGDGMLLRRYLEQGLGLVLERLTSMQQPLEGQTQLTQYAESVCHDSELAKVLGEIFDILGEYGQLDIQPGHGRQPQREYFEGMYWDTGLLSRYFMNGEGGPRVELQNAYLLLTDFEIQDAHALTPILNYIAQSESKSLMIVARKLSDAVIGYLYQLNHGSGNLRVVAVKTPFSNQDDQDAALSDMVQLTGGSAFTQQGAVTLASVKAEHLGQARRAWATPDNFGIVGGKGSPRRLRQHVTSLQAAHSRAQDPQAREKMQKRLAKLLGGSAMLYIGGATESEIELRKTNAERTAAALRAVTGSGVLPGGGVALLNSRDVLSEIGAEEPAEKRAAYRTLARALEEPFRTILSNSGLDPHEWLGELRGADAGYGVDVRTPRIVNMLEAGIMDSAAVLQTAVRSAVSTAALALTIDVLVSRRILYESPRP